MNNTHNRNTAWGAGLAVLAVAFAASARPAAAQTPLLSHAPQVRQAFDGWDHDSDWDRGYSRDRERHVEQERRDAERARREAERARHEAEVRHAQWLREHRHDGDRDRHDFYGVRRYDDRG